MIPTAANSDYPKFVADQVLTSDNLNDLFGYLDEQGRMTRTNLSGIGIVCGLEVKTAADGSSITIIKGVGVTSSGYLVSVPEVTYTKRTTAIFDAVKCGYYSKFVNIAAKTQKFDLWELKQEAEAEGTTLLNSSFLSTGEKIVLIFVELLEENNKNCDPNSCDDKGVNVTVNFRPLLVEKVNVAALLNGAGAVANAWLNLPEISIRRFDVTATPMYECVNIFNAYKKILDNTFLTKTQTGLTQAYNVLQPLLVDEFPTNPFATLANDYKFLHDGTISADQLLAMQYYYDLFSDLLQAYKEFRETGINVIGMCCPDDIFPRHLLLDLAIPDASAQTSTYRHYFIPSPILSNEQKLIGDLKILFKKLTLLTEKFSVPLPAINGTNKVIDSNIRITPSLLADVPFSTKSIPYYYNITNASDTLLKNWSPEKLVWGKTKRNLSYHATNYNATDEEIRQPLLYDLEPYNFLRIEGHIGKPYQHVVKNILALRDKNRLPFEIVALNADISAIITFLKNLSTLMTAGNAGAQGTLESLMGGSCHFNDLELMHDSIMAELSTKLSNEMKFFYDLKRDEKRGTLTMPPPATNVPQVLLLKKTDSVFRFSANTMGHEFEIFYATVKNQPFISFPIFFQSFGQPGNTDLMDFVFKAVIYYIEMLYGTVTTGLGSFNFFNFYTRYYTLIFTVRYIKLINKFYPNQYPLSEEENDHLDAILSIAADGRMIQLYLEFIRRILTVKIMQQAGFYFRSHPGVQHKAGVPVGGTFIVVYHEAEKKETVAQAVAVTNEAVAANVATAAVATNETVAANVATATVAKNEAASFRAAGTNIKAKKTRAGAKTSNEKTNAAEHIEMMSAGIQEKVIVASQKIISGLEQSFRTNSAKTQNVKAANPAAENATVVNTNTATAAAAATATADAANATGTTTSAESSKNTKDAIANYFFESMAYLKNRKADVLDEAIEDFNDGMVIADFYLPYLCCSDCSPIQMVIGGETEKPNESPVADAGADAQTDLTLDPTNGGKRATIKLNGTNSKDPEGKALTFLWKEKSGNTTVTIQNNALAEPTVILRAAGVFTFELTVTDNVGKTDTDEVIITVNEIKLEPANLEIVGKPGPYCNDKGAGQVQLSATPAAGTFSSVPAGVTVQTDANGLFFMPESLAAGTYQLKYAFADGRNDTINFDISQSFKVNFESPKAKRVIVGNSVFFDLTFTVTKITGATYQWNFKIDNGVKQSQQTTVNSIVIRVNREQQILVLGLSAAVSPCSAQTERTFNIEEIIRGGQ